MRRLNVWTLEPMFNGRCRAQEDVGHTIVVPASAIPAWPLLPRRLT